MRWIVKAVAAWLLCVGLVKADAPTPLMVTDTVDDSEMELSGPWKEVPMTSGFRGGKTGWWPAYGGTATATFTLSGAGPGKYGIYANNRVGSQRNQAHYIYIDVGNGEVHTVWSGSGPGIVQIVDETNTNPFYTYDEFHRLDIGQIDLAEGGSVQVTIRADPARTENGEMCIIDAFALVLEETDGEAGGPDPDPDPDPEEPELDYDCNCNGIEDGEELQDPANDANGNGILDACEEEVDGDIVKKKGGCGKYDEEGEEEGEEDEECDDCVCELLEELIEELRNGNLHGHLERLQTETEYTNEGLEKIGENAIRVYEMPGISDFVPQSLELTVPMPNLQERPWFSDPGTTRDYAYFSEGGIFNVGEFEMNTGLYSNGPFPAVVSTLEGTAPIVRAFLLVVGVVVPGVRFVQQQLWTI